MKESVLDILIYLFENYFDPAFELENHERDSNSDAHNRDSLKDELEQAGFPVAAVDSALSWLDALENEHARSLVLPAARAVRVFADSECAKLDTDCRNYILYLVNIGILNVTQRELVIDRLLALDAPTIDIEQAKWVVLMVLFSQPGQEDAYLRMEDLVFSTRPELLH